MFGANAMTLYITFLVLGVGGRIAVQYGLTGDHGIRLVRRTAPKTAKCACVLLITSFIAILVVSCLEATGTIRPQIQLGESGNIIGAAISLAGIAIMVISQWQMGAAWRFGVDETERTDLVTSGLYFSRQKSDLQRRVLVLYRSAGIASPHLYAVFSYPGLFEHRVAGPLRRRTASSSSARRHVRTIRCARRPLFSKVYSGLRTIGKMTFDFD